MSGSAQEMHSPPPRAILFFEKSRSRSYKCRQNARLVGFLNGRTKETRGYRHRSRCIRWIKKASAAAEFPSARILLCSPNTSLAMRGCNTWGLH